MNVLLTGGAGYVGSACLRYLAGRSYGVVAYDDLRKGHVAAVDGHKLVRGDIADTPLLVRTLRENNIDAVMHFAAATDVGESVEDPGYHYGNNIGGTLSLLKAMREVGVGRLIFSSTCATYGNHDSGTLNEDTPQNPCSPYARSKLAVEWLIRDFSDAHGMGFTLLRYFNASGADPSGRFGEAHDPEFHLVPVVLQFCLQQRSKLLVYGNDYPTPDGTCVRDYVHIDDLASAHQLALDATTDVSRATFNVGTGAGSSVLEVIEACRNVVGLDTIRYELAPRRPGDPPYLVADGSKITERLAWKPTYSSIESIVSTAWSWHSRNPKGYKNPN